MAIYRLGDAAPELPGEGRYWIAPGARVIGRVRLGADATIWFGAVLRGDNELLDIGEETNIQDNCILHTDRGFPLTVGARCTIGHGAMLHGCTLASRVLVGMGATVLNGARVGENSVIGAHSLVPEGKEIPSGVLAVGTPARVVRTLRAEELAGLERAAQHYAAKGRRYLADLEEIRAG